MSQPLSQWLRVNYALDKSPCGDRTRHSDIQPKVSQNEIVTMTQSSNIIYLTNSVAQEPEGSSPLSQQPATGLSWASRIQSTPPPKPVSLRSILIPSSHLLNFIIFMFVVLLLHQTRFERGTFQRGFVKINVNVCRKRKIWFYALWSSTANEWEAWSVDSQR
jgi:hypothetical protein